MSGAQGLEPEHEQNPYVTDDAWNTMRAAQAQEGIKIEKIEPSSEYVAHMKQEATRSARATALDLAVRCAQPGSHADAVMGDACKFFEWLTDAT